MAEVVDQSHHQEQHDQQPEPADVTRAVRQVTQAVGRGGAAELLHGGAQAGRVLLPGRGTRAARVRTLVLSGAQLSSAGAGCC